VRILQPVPVQLPSAAGLIGSRGRPTGWPAEKHRVPLCSRLSSRDELKPPAGSGGDWLALQLVLFRIRRAGGCGYGAGCRGCDRLEVQGSGWRAERVPGGRAAGCLPGGKSGAREAGALPVIIITVKV